jgi:hypothetical protein
MPAAGTRMSLAARLTVVALVLFVEKVLLNFFVNFDGPQAATRLGTIVNAAQLLGLRFVVSFAASVGLFSYVSGWRRSMRRPGAWPCECRGWLCKECS